GSGEAGVDRLRDELLRAVGVDAHDAAARVGRPQRAVGLGEDALRPLEIPSDRPDCGPFDLEAVERIHLRPTAANSGSDGCGSKRTRASITAGRPESSARRSAGATSSGRAISSPWQPNARAISA